jgi:hypothetical protein
VINAGDALMLVMPEADELSIEVKVSPQDIDQLQPGQETMLRLSAFNQRTTPELKGKVSLIAADLVTDQRLGAQYYPVRIAFADGERERLGAAKLVPGMPVEGFIQTGYRSVLSYLTKPLTDHLTKAVREEYKANVKLEERGAGAPLLFIYLSRAVRLFAATHRRADHVIGGKISWRIAQKLGKARASAVDTTLDRSHSGAADRGGFLIGQAFRPHEEERFALLRHQALEGGAQILDVEVVHLVRNSFELSRIAAIAVLNFAGALAMLREEGVAQNCEQPSIQVGAGLETLALAPGPQHRVLYEIIGPVGIPGQ